MDAYEKKIKKTLGINESEDDYPVLQADGMIKWRGVLYDRKQLEDITSEEWVKENLK